MFDVELVVTREPREPDDLLQTWNLVELLLLYAPLEELCRSFLFAHVEVMLQAMVSEVFRDFKQSLDLLLFVRSFAQP